MSNKPKGGEKLLFAPPVMKGMASRTTKSEEPWHKKAALSLGNKVVPHEDGSFVKPHRRWEFGVLFRKNVTDALVTEDSGTGPRKVAQVDSHGRVLFDREDTDIDSLKKITTLAIRAHRALVRHAPK